MSDPPPPSTPAIPLARIALILMGYLALNGVCLFAPHVPDVTVLFVWGMVFPFIAVLQTWLWFARSGRRYAEGLVAAIMMTVIFVLAGVGTISICKQIYQAI